MIRPGTRVLLILLLPLVALLGALGSVAPAAAATITVDTCDFESFWSAVREAASGDTITFACSGTIDADVFATHLYDIDKDLTIDGTGQHVTLDGGGQASLFLANQATFTLKGLTLTNGAGRSYASCEDCPTTDYGGVVTQWGGTLNIINCTFRNNVARGLGGGGVIFSLLGTLNISNSTFSDNFTDMEGGVLQSIRSTVNVSNSTFSHNTANEDGGAISISSGTVMISGSTFDGNVATAFNANGAGGAIHNSGDSTMTIINSTFSGNQAEIGGAIANADTTIDVIHSTLVGNTASLYGNGVVNGRRAQIGLSGGGTTRFTNTILANADVPPRGSDGFHLLGYNCGGLGTFFIAASTFSDDISCNSNIFFPTTTADMKLGPLADNGGPTQTIALLPGSILIDRATCQAAAPTDQRGYARPATGLRACDVGAYEVGGVAPIQTATLSAVSGAGVYQGTATLTTRLTVGSTGIGNKSINFYLNGASVGSATTGSDGVATLAGVSLVGFAAGTYAGIVGASFVGGGIYTGANGNGPLTVAQSPATIALDAATLTQTYTSSPRIVTATTTPPGLSYNIDYAGSATPPTDAGSYAVSATITDPGYIGSISGTLTVNQAEQTISLTSTAPVSAVYGDTYGPTASAGSGNPVALAASGACVFDGGTGVVTMTAVGTCIVTADQAGDTNYAAAAQLQQSFSVSRANLSVSANAATMAFGGSLPTLDATVSGLVNGDTFVGLGGSCSAVVNGNPVVADTPTGTYPGALTCSGVDATNYAVTYTAATLTITAAPVFVSDDHVTFQAGTVGAFNMVVMGFPSATFTTADPLPPGVTLGADGLLTGMANDADAGLYVLNVVASNGVTPDATQTFTLTVTQATDITSADHTTFTAGTAGTFTVTTSPAGDTVTETGSLPSGVSFTDNGDGTATLAGTPGAGTGGVYSLRITATNATGFTAQSFTLMVNERASFTSADRTTVVVGAAGSFTVTTTAGYPVATTLTKTGALPAGMSFTDNGDGTATIAGTPTAVGAFPITITASNGASTNATQAFTLSVNQPPTVNSANATDFSIGTAGAFTATTSAFPTPTLTMTGILPAGVTFTDNHNGTATLAGTPAVGTVGAYPIVIRASNGISPDASQNFNLTVAGVQLVSGVCDGTDLVVGGTGGNDTITILAGATAGSVSVTINGQSRGSFTPTGRLIVLAQTGNDTVTVDSKLTLPRIIYGGAGNDTITGGKGHGMQFGGDGDDRLSAGNGRDILVGGTGADTLDGGNGDDILIAGSTAYDAVSTAGALCGLQAEWTRTDLGYAARVAHLTGSTSGGRNGTTLLTATGSGRTVVDDSAVDTITGGLGQDWFLLNTSGGIANDQSDAVKSETRTEL